MELEYLTTGGVIAGVLRQFLPVWIGMALILGPSFIWRRRLGFYGRIFGSGIGVLGLSLVVADGKQFWGQVVATGFDVNTDQSTITPVSFNWQSSIPFAIDWT